MRTKTISIVTLALLSTFTAYWLLNEKRAAKRLNPPSHLTHVGLAYRHDRNDIARFTLSGEVSAPATQTPVRSRP